MGSVHSFFIHYTRLGSLGWKKRKRWYRDNNNNERILYFPSLQLIKKNGNYNENTIFFYPIIIIVVTIGWAESEERAQPHPFPPGSLPRVVHRRKWVCRDYIMGSVLPHARPSLVLTSLLHASLLHSSVNTRRRPAAVPSSRAAMVRGGSDEGTGVGWGSVHGGNGEWSEPSTVGAADRREAAHHRSLRSLVVA